jgi:activator of 2-hydroxyglutaryl-CoA dehydratase
MHTIAGIDVGSGFTKAILIEQGKSEEKPAIVGRGYV